MKRLDPPEPSLHDVRASDAGSEQGALDVVRGRLGDETLERLMSAATARAYAARAEIYPGEQFHIGILVAGVARVFLQAWDGRQLTVRHQRPGTFLGKLPRTAGARVVPRVEALTPCVVLEVPADEFEETLSARHDLAVALHAEALAVLDATYSTLGLNVFGTIRDRLIHILLELAERDPSSTVPTVTTTQQQLADDIGSTREVVTRALSELGAQGLVATAKGRIDLLDPGGLARLVARWTDPGAWSVLA